VPARWQAELATSAGESGAGETPHPRCPPAPLRRIRSSARPAINTPRPRPTTARASLAVNRELVSLYW